MTVPGAGRIPRLDEDLLTSSIPDGHVSDAEFIVTVQADRLSMYQRHMIDLLLDVETGYR